MSGPMHEAPLEFVEPVQLLGEPSEYTERVDASLDAYMRAGYWAIRESGPLRQENQELRAENAALEMEVEQYQEMNAELLLRLFDVRYDMLIDEAVTREGLRDHLQNDETIQQELQEGNWGVIRLDGRFVNYINRYGHEIGDEFIREGGGEIAALIEGLGRTGRDRRADQIVPPLGVERREGDRRTPRETADDALAIPGDIVTRQGAGDEFSVLIRNVTPEQLAIIADRIQARLDVSEAINRYAEGGVPFVASVGSAHASEMLPEVIGEITQERYYDAVKIINDIADRREREKKLDQYKEMWGKVAQLMPETERPLNRPDDRTVAIEFLRRRCPLFFRNPVPYLMGRGSRHPSVESDE